MSGGRSRIKTKTVRGVGTRYEGQLRHTIPRLLEDGLELASADSAKVIISGIWQKSYNTIDAVAINANGDIKVQRDSPFVRTVTPETELYGLWGARTLSDEEFEDIHGDDVLYLSNKDALSLRGGCYSCDPSGKYVPKNATAEEFMDFITRGGVEVRRMLDKVREMRPDWYRRPMSLGLDLDLQRCSPTLHPLIIGSSMFGMMLHGSFAFKRDNELIFGRKPV